MRRFTRWLAELSDERSQHLVFLGHVWLLAPLLLLWTRDAQVQKTLGPEAITQLKPAIVAVIGYLAVRTWLAWKNPPWLKWTRTFPPIDVIVVTVILCLSHRGAMSNIAWLYILPIIEAAAGLSVPWSAAVGFMVVGGTCIAATMGLGAHHDVNATSISELWRENALNIVFRLYFLVVVASLMTYQALIAAAMKQKLAVAADRNRIAADMHDGVQGHLITVATQLDLLARVADKDPERAVELASEAREMTRQGADELRFLVQRMRAPALANGFVPALKQYAHNICVRHGLELSFEVVGANRDLEPEVEGALFRVAQESLNNVMKHAKAKRVLIRLSVSRPSTLVVEDDGVGFDRSCTVGDGLEGMCRRLQELGGSVTVESEPAVGTKVVASI